MSHKKAINNNTKGRKRCKQSAERKNKRSSAVLSLGSCFGERLKSARLMCLNKSSFLCGKKEGKKQPHFFLNFFSQLNFFSFAFKKTKEEFYSRRARYRREYTSHNNNNSLILIARSKEKIYTHTHTLRYIISKCRNHSRTAPRKTQTGTITSRNSESNPRNGCNDCWTDPSRSPFTDGSRGFFSRSCTRYERISSTGITS